MRNATEVEKYMTQMDRFATAAGQEPADPDVEGDEDVDNADPDEGDNDTAGFDDPDDGSDDDTAAPMVRQIMRTFQGINGKKPPTTQQLTGLLSHTFKKGAAQRRVVPPRPEARQPPPSPPRPVIQFRNNLFRNVQKQHGSGNTVTSKGYYYSTSEAVFTGVGGEHGAALILDKTAISFFHEAIDDTTMRLGAIPHVVNPGETNLQYPGKNLYSREVFVISHVGLEFCGMRVLYDDAQLAPLNLDAAVKTTLGGKGTLWDDGHVFLPGEILNDFDGRCRLIDAMFPTGVLYFAWDKKQAGGSRDSQELLISPMQKIPVSRMSLGETSGGANLLEMNEGYVWSLDQQASPGKAGTFEARIRTYEPVMFPIKPVEIKGTFLVPKRLSVILRMTVYGDAIRPKDDLIVAPEQRIRR